MNTDDKKQQDDVVYDDSSEKETKEDISLDSDIVPEEETESSDSLVKKLKEKIKKLEAEKTEYMDGWQRERADFINYKKRVEGEKLEIIKYSNENLISDIIPVLDSFDMAFSNKEAWEKVDKNWRVGVEYIHTQLIKILGENGLKEMNPIGEKFDPKFHVAEEHIETDDESKDGVIITVKKKGYMLNDRVVIAPAVVVAEYKK
ncbi:MAG: nucleotide exchange factor GrpE [Candidatus Pacebacteria bacterium]|nr:nucleotide exchange factor GrpE [Candidatus Paceibacterota bacterium]